MTKLVWHESGQKLYELGVDRGVLYPQNQPGIVWNGLLSVNDSSSDVNESAIYIDGQRLRNKLTFGNFAATVESYTYPEIIEDFRKPFGFCYRTLIGNEIESIDYGYKLHLVYNAIFTSQNREYLSISEEDDTTRFNWDISTTPIAVPNARPSSHFIVDSTKVYPGIMDEIELILYGEDVVDPRMPSVPELLNFFEDNAILKITNHGDGTWTADGPDDVVYMLDETTFEIDWESVVYINEETYSVRSL